MIIYNQTIDTVKKLIIFFSREISCYMVRPLCKAGAVVVIVGYDLAPNGRFYSVGT